MLEDSISPHLYILTLCISRSMQVMCSGALVSSQFMVISVSIHMISHRFSWFIAASLAAFLSWSWLWRAFCLFPMHLRSNSLCWCCCLSGRAHILLGVRGPWPRPWPLWVTGTSLEKCCSWRQLKKGDPRLLAPTQR